MHSNRLPYLNLLAQQISPPTTYICWANRSLYLFSSACFLAMLDCFLPRTFHPPPPRSGFLPSIPSLPEGPIRQHHHPAATRPAHDEASPARRGLLPARRGFPAGGLNGAHDLLPTLGLTDARDLLLRSASPAQVAYS